MCLPCLSPSVCFSWLFSFKVSLCSQCCSGPSVTAPLSLWLLLPCSRTSALPPYPAFLLPLQLHQQRVASGDSSRKGWLVTEHLKSLRSVHLCPGCPERSPETSSSCPCQWTLSTWRVWFILWLPESFQQTFRSLGSWYWEECSSPSLEDLKAFSCQGAVIHVCGEEGVLWVWCQPGPYREFKCSPSYIARPCFEKQKQKQANNNKIYREG